MLKCPLLSYEKSVVNKGLNCQKRFRETSLPLTQNSERLEFRHLGVENLHHLENIGNAVLELGK
jgi:hypothetical protein